MDHKKVATIKFGALESYVLIGVTDLGSSSAWEIRSISEVVPILFLYALKSVIRNILVTDLILPL